MTKDEALDLALKALENSVDLVREDAYNAEKLYGNYPSRQGKVGGLKVLADDHEKAITAIKQALAAPTVQEPVAKDSSNYRLDPPVAEPVAWRYTDAQGHYRYRGYVPNFDVEYQLLKPQALCLCTPPAAKPDVPEGWNLEIVETEFGDVRLTSPDGVAWRFRDTDGSDHFVWKFLTAMLTTPPAAQRQWVGLTDDELRELCEEFWLYPRKLLQAIETKLKEKNT